MTDPITEADEGKRVVGPNDESVGTVEKVDQGVAHIDPHPELSESVKQRLDWGERDDYTLQETEVERSTDETIVLRSE